MIINEKNDASGKSKIDCEKLQNFSKKNAKEKGSGRSCCDTSIEDPLHKMEIICDNMPVQNASRELEKKWFGKKWIGIANKYLLQLQHPLCHVSDSAVTQEFEAFYHFVKRSTYSFERLKAIQKALKASF